MSSDTAWAFGMPLAEAPAARIRCIPIRGVSPDPGDTIVRTEGWSLPTHRISCPIAGVAGSANITVRMRFGTGCRLEAAYAFAPKTRSVLVWGRVDADGDPFLEPSLIVDALPALPPSGSDFVVRGRTDAGNEVFSLRFDMPETPDADDGSSGFVFAVPVTWQGELETITLAGGDGIRHSQRRHEPADDHPPGRGDGSGTCHSAPSGGTGDGCGGRTPSGNPVQPAYRAEGAGCAFAPVH